MLGFFVQPQPDETLYSIFARYGEKVQYPGRLKLLHELTGSLNPINLNFLPCRLDHLLAMLPPGHSLTGNYLMDHHTLLPFVGCFWSPQRVCFLREAMCSASGNRAEVFAGLHASHMPLPLWVRYCRTCADEDRERLGFRYWHRMHQLPAIDICPLHGVPLQNSSVPSLVRGQWRALVSAEAGIRESTRRSEAVDIDPRKLRLARGCQWILNNPGNGVNPAELRDRYFSLLRAKGLATWSDRLRRNSLISEFLDFYSRKFLKSVHCTIGGPDRNNWLIRMFYSSRIRMVHPLQHLLLIHWLGYSVSEFLETKMESLPFGSGPWPCLNRATDHFQRVIISSCQITRSPVGGVPLGTFSCPICLFTYVRRGPDGQPEDMLRIGKVRIWGRDWDNNLRRLWMDPTIEFREMGVRLGVCFATIKRQAARLGLPPRHSLNSATRVISKKGALNARKYDGKTGRRMV